MSEEQRLDYLGHIDIDAGQEGATTQPAVYPDHPIPDEAFEAREQRWNLIRGEELE
jgi:hypothetical protein